VAEVKPLSRMSFAATTPEDAFPVLHPFFPDARMSASGAEGFRFDLDVVDAGLISTMRYRFASPDSVATSDGTGVVTIGHVLGGNVRMAAGKSEIDMTKPFLLPPRPFQGRWDDVHVGGLTLDLTEVERFASLVTGREGERLAFTGTAPATPALSRLWTATVRTLNRDLLRDDEAMASPLVQRAAFGQVALAVLAVFPNTHLAEHDPSLAAGAVPVVVRRAKAFMDDNLGSPITTADVAAAAGLSLRGLTAAFRRELDTTPAAYLRAGRLAAAHRDLVISDPTAGTTVSVVAHRWGFTNPGRFAAAHRAQYGVNPHDTLGN